MTGLVVLDDLGKSATVGDERRAGTRMDCIQYTLVRETTGVSSDLYE
ncbi:MAG: hypothetical protein GX620_06630 [Chloroflexi bacterium]|nr:hypothetical protein [Chloroflexota bacterium]